MSRTPATSVIVRLEASDEVQRELTGLRARTASVVQGEWAPQTDRRFVRADLSWPVDLVVTPRVNGTPGAIFEVIVDALDDDGVLVQARGLSSFVPREQHVLVLHLERCGAQALGRVCEADVGCLGSGCFSCVDGDCAQTPVSLGRDLPVFDGALGSVGQPEAADDASLQDGGADSGGVGPDDAGLALTPDGSSSPCHEGVCAGGKCVVDRMGFHCTCAAEDGYVVAADSKSCADIDECATANCPAEYPCQQTEPPGYTCIGQFADWPMPDAVVGAKVKPSYDVATVPRVVIDNVTGLWWQRAVDPGTFDWAAAKAYCAALSLADFDDWRLPGMIELMSIADHTQYGPAIDSAAFPNTPQDLFWTTSLALEATPVPYWVAFHDGDSYANPPQGENRVRCVRNAPVKPGTPATRYVQNTGGGTVSDTRTGLTWNFLYAGDANQTVRLAGSNCLSFGMRVPTAKEMLTLIDPRSSAPAANKSELIGLADGAYLTGSPDLTPPIPVNQTPVWVVDLTHGYAESGSTAGRAVCVR